MIHRTPPTEHLEGIRIGIDPGAKGAIFITGFDDFEDLQTYALDMIDLPALEQLLLFEEVISVSVEAIHAIRGDTPQTAFGLGKSVGEIEYVLSKCYDKKPFERYAVRAQKWQAWVRSEIYGRGGRKSGNKEALIEWFESKYGLAERDDIAAAAAIALAGPEAGTRV